MRALAWLFMGQIDACVFFFFKKPHFIQTLFPHSNLLTPLTDGNRRKIVINGVFTPQKERFYHNCKHSVCTNSLNCTQCVCINSHNCTHSRYSWMCTLYKESCHSCCSKAVLTGSAAMCNRKHLSDSLLASFVLCVCCDWIIMLEQFGVPHSSCSVEVTWTPPHNDQMYCTTI